MFEDRFLATYFYLEFQKLLKVKTKMLKFDAQVAAISLACVLKQSCCLETRKSGTMPKLSPPQPKVVE